MDCERLDADEVLAVSDALREVESVCLFKKEGVSGCLSDHGNVKHLRDISQVPPGNFGPISWILNHTLPDPSNDAAVDGALAMYTEMGPW